MTANKPHKPQTPHPEPPRTNGAHDPTIRLVTPAGDGPKRSVLQAAADAWLPAPETFFFAKGRVALYAILRAMGIGDGDEVLVPGYTCVVVPSAIAYTGARPVYYDIDPNSYCGDPVNAQSRITNHTRAIVIQHTYGMPSEDTDLIELCRERGIHVIEDCAHAMGGLLDGKPLGTLGDAAFASYQWSKPVTVGLGGVARINDETLLPAMRETTVNGFIEPSTVKSLSIMTLAWLHRTCLTPRLYWQARGLYQALGRAGFVTPSSSTDELENPSVMPEGYCERLGRQRMGQLTRAMQRLPDTVAHANHIATIYDDWCRQRGLASQPQPANATPVYLRYPVRVRDRDQLLEAAREQRIELGDWFNAPLHPDTWQSSALGFNPGTCPNAEHAAVHVINLPTHARIDQNEANRILKFLETHKSAMAPQPPTPNTQPPTPVRSAP